MSDLNILLSIDCDKSRMNLQSSTDKDVHILLSWLDHLDSFFGGTSYRSVIVKLENAKSKIENLKEERDDLQHDLDMMESETDSLIYEHEEKVEELDGEICELRGKLNTLTDEKKNQDDLVIQLKEDLIKLKDEMVEQGSKHSDQLGDLNLIITDLRGDNEDQLATINKLTQQLEEKNRELRRHIESIRDKDGYY